ncbi:hypothetical protein [Arthrobacter sp. UM1]|uniref:hypothetical protein n=1 Tax=Arthrobacter sp. UM1 TaxID=2766776 RepID=UPI001CF613D6|nr:hypothetical protein [Arthrobacter sp. UM1]MCB4208539.1 hypothetical protein [Arthrobacter sp. UM1]
MRQYDQQVVEAVTLRRQRVQNAVFFGGARWRRQLPDQLRPLLMGVIVAAVIAAGCIATSFIVNLIEKQQAEQAKLRRGAAPASVTQIHPTGTEGLLS